ncbi:MAG: FAD-dependent oxidoreductase [Pseudomonadota bacterium]
MNSEYTIQTAKEEALRCLMCSDAPCNSGCPAGVDVRRFIRKIRMDNIKGAIRQLRRGNVMAGSCAYICPSSDTCCKECSIKGLKEPIDIRGLQRFLMDYERKFGMIEPISHHKKSKKSVAIVGAGPAGLACAADLSMKGYEVVIFDAAKVAGGMLSQVIPEFRLPKKVVGFDVEFIKKLGPTLRLGKMIDDPRSLKKDFDAVFVACGLSKSKTPELKGVKLKGVYKALDFLRLAKAKKLKLKGRVVIIGGGDTALDCARVAKELKMESFLLYRRTQGQMPASHEEILGAWNSGVEFYFRYLPKSILGNKKVEGIRGVRICWQNKNKFVEEGTPFDIKCDSVVFAVGQDVEDQFGLRCAVNKVTTSEPGIFAGGDFVYGASTAVGAVGSGKLAAIEIDKYLGMSS